MSRADHKKSSEPINPTNTTATEKGPEAEEPEMLACVLARDPVTGRVRPVCGPKLSPAKSALLLAKEAAETECEAANAETEADGEADVEVGRDDDAEGDAIEYQAGEGHADEGEDFAGEEQDVKPPKPLGTGGLGGRRRSR